MVAAYIVEYEKTRRCEKPTTGGWPNDWLAVDLTSSAGEGWVPVPAKFGSYPDLADTKVFTILAFAVPVGLLVLGAALGWVIIGFKP
jgi:hypothetical protein